jgi:hypothetical protein
MSYVEQYTNIIFDEGKHECCLFCHHFTPYFSKVNFNLISPNTPRSPKPIEVSCLNLVLISHFTPFALRVPSALLLFTTWLRFLVT